MKNKTKAKLKEKLYPIIKIANVGGFKEETLLKIWRFYIKAMDAVFKFLSAVTFTLIFTYFLPQILHYTETQIIILLLCGILLYLRFGKITIEFAEEEEKE